MTKTSVARLYIPNQVFTLHPFTFMKNSAEISGSLAQKPNSRRSLVFTRRSLVFNGKQVSHQSLEQSAGLSVPFRIPNPRRSPVVGKVSQSLGLHVGHISQREILHTAEPLNLHPLNEFQLSFDKFCRSISGDGR